MSKQRWWTLITYLYLTGHLKLDTTPRERIEYECADCGRRYHGDPYYLPNCCENCGGRYVEKSVKLPVW